MGFTHDGGDPSTNSGSHHVRHTCDTLWLAFPGQMRRMGTLVYAYQDYLMVVLFLDSIGGCCDAQLKQLNCGDAELKANAPQI